MHEVAATEQYLILPPIPEIVDSGMFKESPYYACLPYIVTDAFDPGAETT
jgi:hypothetical protein